MGEHDLYGDADTFTQAELDANGSPQSGQRQPEHHGNSDSNEHRRDRQPEHPDHPNPVNEGGEELRTASLSAPGHGQATATW